MITIYLTGFISAFCFIYGLYKTVFAEKIEVDARLNHIKKYSKTPDNLRAMELETSFFDRVVRPALHWISSITKKFTPIKKKEIIEKKLILAGGVLGLNSSEYISVYYLFTMASGIIIMIISYFIEASVLLQILCLLWGFILSRIIIELLLKIKIQKRQYSIVKELPEVLDLLTVSVEAGLGFDAAVQKVVQKKEGPITVEFSRTLQEIKMGNPRKEALRDMANRTGVEDLNNFITAIIQADQLGVSIGNVLRVQSKQMRQMRKQRIEEKAMKAPIKMLLPMVFFIFPTIFLVLLGPAMIQIIESLR